MIEDTYLRLRGWEAFLIKIRDEMAYIMYNPSQQVIINQKEILRNESFTPDYYKGFPEIFVELVKFSEVSPSLIQAVFDFEEVFRSE